MSELRAALLILGVVFIAALAWWERRRPRQVARQPGGELPESSEQREIVLELPEIYAHEPLVPRPGLAPLDPQPARELPVLEVPAPEELEAVPPSSLAAVQVVPPAGEPLAAPSALIEPAATQPAPNEPPVQPPASDGAPAAAEAACIPVAAADGPGPALPELASPAPPLVEWPPDAERRVMALRLVAPQPERFAGRSLRQALAAEGFVLGRFDIFHKPDDERRAVVSAASLTRPGTFDVETMDSQHYGGLSLFAVLPGPMPPPQAFDELVSTARSLNDRLCGVLQDESGTPLTPARIATLRERIRSGAVS